MQDRYFNVSAFSHFINLGRTIDWRARGAHSSNITSTPSHLLPLANYDTHDLLSRNIFSILSIFIYDSCPVCFVLCKRCTDNDIVLSCISRSRGRVRKFNNDSTEDWTLFESFVSFSWSRSRSKFASRQATRIGRTISFRIYHEQTERNEDTEPRKSREFFQYTSAFYGRWIPKFQRCFMPPLSTRGSPVSFNPTHLLRRRRAGFALLNNLSFNTELMRDIYSSAARAHRMIYALFQWATIRGNGGCHVLTFVPRNVNVVVETIAGMSMKLRVSVFGLFFCKSMKIYFLNGGTVPLLFRRNFVFI